MACADASAESIRPCIYKIHGRFRPKLFPVCFIPTDFPFSFFLQLKIIRRWRHSSYNPLQWSPHTHMHKTREWKEKSINVRKCSADHHESRKKKNNKNCAMLLPVGSRKCCTYVLYKYYSERNTWSKTHTFHQVPIRPAARCHSRGDPPTFALFSLSLSLFSLVSYRSRNMFHYSLPDRIYSSSTRRVCAPISV